MKAIYSDNKNLIQLLVDNGFIIMCDENMNMTIEDEDAIQIDEFVRINAPAAVNDYIIADIINQ